MHRTPSSSDPQVSSQVCKLLSDLVDRDLLGYPEEGLRFWPGRMWSKDAAGHVNGKGCSAHFCAPVTKGLMIQVRGTCAEEKHPVPCLALNQSWSSINHGAAH